MTTLDTTKWYRTCQECGYQMNTPPPPGDRELPRAYQYRKCPKCRTSALDYGTYTLKDEDTSTDTDERPQ